MIRRLLPAACVVGVVATTIASWRLRFGFESIARTGSGGVGTIKHLGDGVANALLLGLLAAAAVLVVGLVRRRTVSRGDWLSPLATLAGVAFLALVVVMLSAFYYDMLTPLGVAAPPWIPRLWTAVDRADLARTASSSAALLQWVNFSGIAVSLLVLAVAARNLRTLRT